MFACLIAMHYILGLFCCTCAQKVVKVWVMVNNEMGSAGFEPATSSARGWHHTKLDNDPKIDFISYHIKFRISNC